MTNVDWGSFKAWLWGLMSTIGPKLLLSLLLLGGGAFAIRLLSRLLRKAFRRYHIEPSLASFFESLFKFALYALLIVTVGTTLGIKTSSFVAIIGAAGIAIGLALQGSLANFAGGVLILIFKPFKVGDLIHVNGNLGKVVKIDILYTRLQTFDNRIITMPNGNVANSDVDNRTMQSSRRIDLNFKFDYDADIPQIREIVTRTLRQHPKVLAEPAPDLWLDQIGAYELKVIARCWVAPQDYWPVIWQQYEAVKVALAEAGVRMPLPKQEIVWQPPAQEGGGAPFGKARSAQAGS
ncbi:mechanosensitive ion channel family protein [Phaeodactylibacter luteus]|uniref:Mechanosensitive ion channel family protein n=1 Tax=Phaeodactylibacter luteus TaxID=1564516 RepID=A0A5C6RKJ1_9BACT|nr:mechanosensitive ion channel family protein [Phaeodactylibacter luteus]TXB62130.1 mechanosensitive ion channel family protein [Phaeodactylibacter luteus]